MIAPADGTRQGPAEAPAPGLPEAPDPRRDACPERGRTARRERRRRRQRMLGDLMVALAPLIAFIFRMWMATVKIRWVGYGPYRELEERGEKVIYAAPHGRMLPFVYTHAFRGAVTMFSEHRDGEIIARLGEAIGFTPVRGSTSRGGAKAFLRMLRRFRDATDFVILPDGPKGPAFEANPGAIVLSQRLGAWIATASFAADRQWEAPSWDRFRIPLPFTRLTVVMSEPMRIDRRASAEEITAAQRRLSDVMKDLDRRVPEVHRQRAPEGVGPLPWVGRRARAHVARNRAGLREEKTAS